jgi:hypothetical protein
MFRRLLVCTNLSDGLHRLAHFVPSLAAGGVKQITFLHIIPISGEREIPRIDEQQVSAARDRHLIMVGTPTCSLITEKLMGSTLMDLCQRVAVPLMILRPQLFKLSSPLPWILSSFIRILGFRVSSAAFR